MIILASTSKYRQKLMQDAGFEAVCAAPDYQEIAVPGMHPLDLIDRHARGKAESLKNKYPNDIIVGADQGLVDGSVLLGKPGTVENACAQLKSLRGKSAVLASSLVVVYKNKTMCWQDRAILSFRSDLSDAMIEKYILADMPLDCAGSFKIESRGVRLFDKIECCDPTAIQGLPMMKLTAFLAACDPSIDEIF